MKRGLSLAGVFLLAALSSASFELVLGIDETNMQIDRFDGVTGAYLGSFAKGVTGGGGALAIDQSKGLCYNNNFLYRTVQVWNYNTGEFVNEYATTNTLHGLAINNAGELLWGTTSGIQRVNPSTGAVIATYSGGVSFSGVEQAPDGSYVAVDVTNNRLVKFTPVLSKPDLLHFPWVWLARFSGRLRLRGRKDTPLTMTRLSNLRSVDRRQSWAQAIIRDPLSAF